MMAETFLDEALSRLISKGVVAREGVGLRFTDEWVGHLTRRLNHTMSRVEIKQRIVEALTEYYDKKGYAGDIRFDLLWVKQIFVEQLKTLDGEQRSLLSEFIEAVKLLGD